MAGSPGPEGTQVEEDVLVAAAAQEECQALQRQLCEGLEDYWLDKVPPSPTAWALQVPCQRSALPSHGLWGAEECSGRSGQAKTFCGACLQAVS